LVVLYIPIPPGMKDHSGMEGKKQQHRQHPQPVDIVAAI
jgi:hypothetical protein